MSRERDGNQPPESLCGFVRHELAFLLMRNFSHFRRFFRDVTITIPSVFMLFYQRVLSVLVGASHSQEAERLQQSI